ncbi:MAG: ABC transporter permease [Spirochaetales bacterium]|nr:ABC transporter permease [Spirochaetales bacterium]MCF7938432.1 ABC transporter permease [Spirochaetales bacterium]
MKFVERWVAGTPLQVPYLKFRSRTLGRISLTILLILYGSVLFEGFLAPYDANTKFKEKSYHPPHRIRLFHQGKLIGPFVYEYKMVNPVFKEYQVDRSTPHPLSFFVKGDEYKLFFLFPSKTHLFGTSDDSPFFLFGTDRLGRDLLSRIIYGAKISLSIGFVSIFIALGGGILIGGFSGYLGGLTDWLIMRGAEVIILLPTFYFFLFLRSIIPTDIPPAQKFFYITIILAIPSWAGSARGIRNWVLSLKNSDFVTAAEINGMPSLKVILVHIIPQIRNLLILNITLSVPGVILGEAGLSFLNLGITEPSVSWGMLMSAAMDINILLQYPWILLPALIIILTVFSFFSFGYALKDAFDPKTIVGSGAAKQKTGTGKTLRLRFFRSSKP